MRSRSTYNTLVRIFVGKIEPAKVVDLEKILEDVEIIQNDTAWTCKSWMKTAIVQLGKAGIIKPLSTDKIVDTGNWYAGKKVAEGRFQTNKDSDKPFDTRIPTWDLIAGEETQA
jgi:hypothetical protein